MSTEVHIIDDDDAVRDSLSFLCLTAGIEARSYESPLDFLQAAPGLENGCIVTDVRMPHMDGLALVKRLQELEWRLPVIVITGHGDVPMAVAAMKAGAFDFLEKPFDDNAFLSAVRAALASANDRPPRPEAANAPNAKLSLLSERERQVLEGLLDGQPNKVIAYNLGISPRTVEIYRAKLMGKMEAATFADLIRMAISSRPTDE